MRVILYARVSTDEQCISLDAQIAKMRAYAGLYDLEIVEVIAESESAKSLKRPGLQRALAMLGDVDGIVIVKLDRLTRSVADWQHLIDEYFSQWQLFSVSDSIDTRTAAGRLVLNVLLSVAQWEREAIGERTRDALRHKISRGERCGKVRYGFDLGADGKTLVTNGREQAVIGQMVALRREGWTFRGIAGELTRLGVPTKEGRDVWTHSSVRRILKRVSHEKAAA